MKNLVRTSNHQTVLCTKTSKQVGCIRSIDGCGNYQNKSELRELNDEYCTKLREYYYYFLYCWFTSSKKQLQNCMMKVYRELYGTHP